MQKLLDDVKDQERALNRKIAAICDRGGVRKKIEVILTTHPVYRDLESCVLIDDVETNPLSAATEKIIEAAIAELEQEIARVHRA